MTEQEQINKIQTIAVELEGEFRSNYSGRGMYGRQCVGIVVDSREAGLMAVGEAGLPQPKVDNMGRGWILYWPGLEMPTREQLFLELQSFTEDCIMTGHLSDDAPVNEQCGRTLGDLLDMLRKSSH